MLMRPYRTSPIDWNRLLILLKTVTIPAKLIKRDPWMTVGLLTSSRHCTRLYRKCVRKSRTDIAYKTYTTYRNTYILKRTAKQTYYAQLFEKYINDIRNTWKTINYIIGINNDKTSTPQSHTINNEIVYNTKRIADSFCDYFTNIGPKYANDIPMPAKSSDYYINKNRTSNPHSVFMTPTYSDEICKILKISKPKKSAGHDNISTQFHKTVEQHIAMPIGILVSISLQSGIFPDTLNLPQFKNDVNNYRPSSLLSSISKIIERVVHRRLYSFLDVNDILYKTNLVLEENIAP